MAFPTGVPLGTQYTNAAGTTFELAKLPDVWKIAGSSAATGLLDCAGGAINAGDQIARCSDVNTSTFSQAATGVITHEDGDGTTTTANVVSGDADNLVVPGTDGGALVLLRDECGNPITSDEQIRTMDEVQTFSSNITLFPADVTDAELAAAPLNVPVARPTLVFAFTNPHCRPVDVLCVARMGNTQINIAEDNIVGAQYIGSSGLALPFAEMDTNGRSGIPIFTHAMGSHCGVQTFAGLAPGATVTLTIIPRYVVRQAYNPNPNAFVSFNAIDVAFYATAR